jgi:energy-coupling factor transport system ATP-binding protein
MTPRVELAQVERRRGDAWPSLLPALAVAPGERLAVIGPCDSGKTLLGQLVAGIADDRHIRGGARLDGTPVAALGRRELARRVGLVPSDPQLLFSGMRATLAGELELSLQLLGLDAEAGRARIAATAGRLDLAPLLGRDPFTLSGGEQVRAALALVLVKAPEVLVLDDCFAPLDPETAGAMARQVAGTAAAGAAVIELHALAPPWAADCDRCVILTDGGPVIGPYDAVCSDIARADPALLGLLEPGAAVGHATGGPALAAHGIAFGYPGGFRLGPLDVSVARGEAVALLGRNGAGKTTLLKCLALLLRARDGEIRAGDGLASPPPPRRQHEWARRVLYAFQNPDDQLYLPSVRRELQETAALAGIPDAAARVPEVARRLGLADLLDRAPMDLPRAQRRLVTLGACLVAAPAVLLLDEPTAALDGRQRQRLHAALADYVRRGGAILLVSHDLDFVARLASAALVMRGGGILRRIALPPPAAGSAAALAAALRETPPG